MKICLFSDNQGVRAYFKSCRNCLPDLSVKSIRYIKRELKREEEESFIYLDIESLGREKADALISAIKETELPWGIIDPEGREPDPAGYFHAGASDYIGKALLEGCGGDRFRRVLRFAKGEGSHETEERGEECAGWDDIVPGREYPFFMMFIQVTPHSEWKTKTGKGHLETMQTRFHDVVERATAPYDGKIWMWNHWGGLVLFPYRERECDAFIPALRLHLNKALISIEEECFNSRLSFRIALNAGRTTYSPRGETGTIISDSVNFIFHLGQKFTPEGGFCITKAIYELLPDGLKPYFSYSEDFEGHPVYALLSLY